MCETGRPRSASRRGAGDRERLDEYDLVDRLYDRARPCRGGVREADRPRSMARLGGVRDRVLERDEYDDPV